MQSPPPTTDEEKWAPVPSFPRHHVSTDGRVWREAYSDRLGRPIPAKEISSHHHADRDHMVVHLCRDGAFYTRRVARLVMLAHGPAPERATDWVALEDPDGPLHINNLQWEAPRTRCKLTKGEVMEIYRAAHGTDATQREIAEGYGISPQTVSAVKNGYTWARVTGHER